MLVLCTVVGCHFRVQSEVGLNILPQLSERIGPIIKNATDSTDSTDSKNLADDRFELEQPVPAHD
jgi:hypothetical protein